MEAIVKNTPVIEDMPTEEIRLVSKQLHSILHNIIEAANETDLRDRMKRFSDKLEESGEHSYFYCGFASSYMWVKQTDCLEPRLIIVNYIS